MISCVSATTYSEAFVKITAPDIRVTILGSTVTSSETLLNGYSMLYKTPSPYFIVLANPMQILQVKAMEFHRIRLNYSQTKE